MRKCLQHQARLNRVTPVNGDRYAELGRMFAEVLDRGWELYHGQKPAPKSEPVVITGAAVGLPGTEHIFDDGNIARLLQRRSVHRSHPAAASVAPCSTRHIRRLVKSEKASRPSNPSPM